MLRGGKEANPVGRSKKYDYVSNFNLKRRARSRSSSPENKRPALIDQAGPSGLSPQNVNVVINMTDSSLDSVDVGFDPIPSRNPSSPQAGPSGLSPQHLNVVINSQKSRLPLHLRWVEPQIFDNPSANIDHLVNRVRNRGVLYVRRNNDLFAVRQILRGEILFVFRGRSRTMSGICFPAYSTTDAIERKMELIENTQRPNPFMHANKQIASVN